MNGKIFIAALAGLGTGMAIGMLFAPEKGEVTRSRIAEKASDITDKVKTTASETLEKINQYGNAARETFAKLGSEAKEN